MNWLPISNRINQRILSTTFKFLNDMGPNYLNEVFQWAAESNRTLRNNYLKLVNQYLCHNLGYKQKIQVIGHNQFILVLPTFQLIQQLLSRTRC